MVKTTLLLSAAIAVAIGSGPVMAQSYSPAYSQGYAPAYGPDCAHCVQVPVRDTDGYAGYSGSSYESRSRETLAGGPAVYEQRSMETRSSESRSYQEQRSIQSDLYAADRRAARIHHTTDAAGYLSWVGKTSDMAIGQQGDRYGPPPAYGHREEAVGGPGCPSVHGERVVSCRYIPFTPVEQSISISDEDFAYEGGAGPAFIGGGGGGGGGSSMGFGGGFASASSSSSSSASASAVVSSNVSVNISGHMSSHGGGYGGGGYGGGGHGGGHTGGYGGGGYGGGSWGGGMGGGHMKSGCGCKK